jgi:hypothetical protein
VAAGVMSHTVTVSLNALVTIGKGNCNVCYEIFSVM